MSLTFLKGQVGFMRFKGFEVQALCSPGPEVEEFEKDEGIRVHSVEMPRRITPVADLAAIRKIIKVIRNERPTIVHAHTPKGGLLGMIAAAIARVPVRIYHMRGLPMEGAQGPKRVLLKTTERVACSLAHQVIAVSHSMREIAVEQGICPSHKMKVIAGGSGQGVDADERFNPARLNDDTRNTVRERFGIPPEATVIGYVGRLVGDKGIVELASAWQQLRAKHPDAHLLLVGPFEPQDPVPAEVQSMLEADERVHFAGMDWNTPPLYAAMDIVTLPTYREGFPNVPLEAASMELPVVATRIPGCKDAIEEGVTGMLVPSRDAGALADAIDTYLHNPELRRRHGLAGRERVLKEFRREVIWEGIRETYEESLRSSAAMAGA